MNTIDFKLIENSLIRTTIHSEGMTDLHVDDDALDLIQRIALVAGLKVTAGPMTGDADNG